MIKFGRRSRGRISQKRAENHPIRRVSSQRHYREGTSGSSGKPLHTCRLLHRRPNLPHLDNPRPSGGAGNMGEEKRERK